MRVSKSALFTPSMHLFDKFPFSSFLYLLCALRVTPWLVWYWTENVWKVLKKNPKEWAQSHLCSSIRSKVIPHTRKFFPKIEVENGHPLPQGQKWFCFLKKRQGTDWQGTDRPTNQQTDKVTCRVLCTRLKIEEEEEAPTVYTLLQYDCLRVPPKNISYLGSLMC